MNDGGAHVLVVEDEPDVALGLQLLLERAGYRVSTAFDGLEGVREFFAEPADLVILDVAMPVMDGWKTLSRLREVSDVPVLMLTARAMDVEKVRGLSEGADDYQTKPFSNNELVARVAALLRRRTTPAKAFETYADARLQVDFARREVRADGKLAELTRREFNLLRTFVENADRVLQHREIIELAWGYPDAVSRDEVKTYVRYLRRKLDWGGGPDDPIQSVRGVGYRYRPAR